MDLYAYWARVLLRPRAFVDLGDNWPQVKAQSVSSSPLGLGCVPGACGLGLNGSFELAHGYPPSGDKGSVTGSHFFKGIPGGLWMHPITPDGLGGPYPREIPHRFPQDFLLLFSSS